MMSAQQARARAAHRRTSPFPPAGSSSESVIPFDHAASFDLKGIPGNIVQDVINISSEGTFVAVAIGYGFEEDRARAVKLGPANSLGSNSPESNPGPAAAVGRVLTNDFLPSKLRLSQVPVAALIEGFRLNPNFDRLIFADTPQTAGGRRGVSRDRNFSALPIPNTFDESIIQRIKPLEEISFLFSIVDSGTGRELQDEPIHNLASLGKSNGERPFRMLAQPLTFQPRSTIRLQIIERSEGVLGTLFIVLYGYKILGSCPEPLARALSATASAARANGNSSSRIVPFDYVSKFQLTGTPGNEIEDEVPINAEGGFVATSIGYGLGVDSLDVTLNPFAQFATAEGKTSLGDVPFSAFPTGALQDGIRIRPNFVRIAFTNGGQLEPLFPGDLLNRAFERLNRPEDVSFRYSIFDTGTGRELQNQPINNIAGLGIANGDRPFKPLARPLMLLPRSTIRVNVEEHFGRGTLFIVFQGYKLLDAPAAPQIPGQMPVARRRARR